MVRGNSSLFAKSRSAWPLTNTEKKKKQKKKKNSNLFFFRTEYFGLWLIIVAVDIFYDKANFGNLGVYMGKSKTNYWTDDDNFNM